MSADPSKVAAWTERLGASSIKVGIAWAGAPGNEIDRYRSPSIDQLLPLLRTQGVKFISLQKGEAAQKLSQLHGEFDHVSDMSPLLSDFSDTAALIQSLDIVVSTDSSVARLAGAMGKQACVLVSFAPDWRWWPNQEWSVWYPTVRLLRQPRLNDWQNPVERAAVALEELKLTKMSRA